MLKTADIFRRYAPAYLQRFAAAMLPSHRRALSDILACRTPLMGGHLLRCPRCGPLRFVYHSCRNRACPECHAARTVRWLAARAQELLPVTYYHVVFTLPSELRRLARSRQADVLGALMQAAAAALQTLAADPTWLGGRIGILAVLHTWTRALLWHPHVHCLVPGVVVRGDRSWERVRGRFLVPVCALSPVFRAKFAQALRRRLPGIKLPEAVWNKDWVVYARACNEGPEGVLQYLARYAFRGPLSDRRLRGFDSSGRIVLQFRDTRSCELRTVRLTPLELLRRYLQHTLPSGFHRVRYYGLWSPANRPVLRTLRLQLASGLAQFALRLAATEQRLRRPFRCPVCGALCVPTDFRPRVPRLSLLPSRGPPRIACA